mgnify:CR=1 FL=1
MKLQNLVAQARLDSPLGPMTVAATAQQANAAPISCPTCWRAGVAPTSQPVLRS